MVKVPVPYTLAGAEPEMVPNRALAKMATLAGPPFEFFVSRQARSIKTLLMPLTCRNAPNMTKAKIIVEATARGVP